MADQGPCGDCGHAFAVHAPDINYPGLLRCFHNASTGDGCTDKYDERCKNYAPPKKDN